MADAWDQLWDVIKAPPWGQVGLALAILGSIPALVGFAFWIAERRRRPEIEFLWKVSTTGDEADLAGWPPDAVPEMRPGKGMLIEASVRNIGDAATQHAMMNFVAPASVQMVMVSGSESSAATQVGGHPIIFIASEFGLPPGTWRLQRFVVSPPNSPGGLRFRLTVSDNGLNATGQRWFPSRLVGFDDADATAYSDLWPPRRPSVRRQWKRVRSEPHGRVWCVRCERADVRDVVVVDPEGPAEKDQPESVSPDQG